MLFTRCGFAALRKFAASDSIPLDGDLRTELQHWHHYPPGTVLSLGALSVMSRFELKQILRGEVGGVVLFYKPLNIGQGMLDACRAHSTHQHPRDACFLQRLGLLSAALGG
jgi:hypothetical protein